jgi:RNA polymerase sigma factor (sigma-70 family)
MAAATTLPRVQLRIPLKALGDDRLARMAAEGDRDALAAIFERHHQALYRYCRGLLGSTEDAQDAVASAMARVVRSLPGEARTVALKPWLYRIAHNEAMRIARRRRPRADLEEAADLAAPDGTDGALARERLQMLLGDLEELSEHQRGALVLREMEGAGFARISEVFGVSEAAAKQTVYEARVCLADFEKGRAMRCEQITRALSDGDRRRLRGRAMRAHLRVCHDCRTFGEALRSRPGELRALAPPRRRWPAAPAGRRSPRPAGLQPRSRSRAW